MYTVVWSMGMDCMRNKKTERRKGGSEAETRFNSKYTHSYETTLPRNIVWLRVPMEDWKRQLAQFWSYRRATKGWLCVYNYVYGKVRSKDVASCYPVDTFEIFFWVRSLVSFLFIGWLLCEDLYNSTWYKKDFCERETTKNHSSECECVWDLSFFLHVVCMSLDIFLAFDFSWCWLSELFLVQPFAFFFQPLWLYLKSFGKFGC